MKRPAALLACALATFGALIPAAGAMPRFGAAEDGTKYADDGGDWLDGQLNALGMVENRMTIRWDPSQPTVIQDKGFLDRSLPVSARHGIQVVFNVFPTGAFAITEDLDTRIALFAAYLQELAHTYPWVTDYISQRPDHLTTAPPRHEEPFSTPRAWHILSDLLHSYGAGSADGPEMPDELLRILALGTVSASHAGQFRGYVRQLRHAWSLDALLKGTMHWPADPAERDVCYFLAQGLRARLAKELPESRAQLGGGTIQLAHRAKALLTELAEISVEAAQMVVAGAQDGVTEDGSDARLPSWFMVEVVRDLPRLAAARDGTKV